MAYALTVLFLFLTYLSPQEVMPSLAPLRLMVWIGGAGLLAGLLTATQNRAILSMPQGFLMLGFIFAVVFSRLAHLRLGASWSALIEFLPSAIVFFLILFAGNSPGRLRGVARVLLIIALYFTVHGAISYFVNPEESRLVLYRRELLPSGEIFELARMRAVGFLNDPNDLAQFLLVALALSTKSWYGSAPAKFIRVIAPSLVLVVGVALTHSRGGFLGLLTVIVVALADKVGKAKSIAITGMLALALLAMNFTADRTISYTAGEDRIAIWRDGWGLFKSSPIWGIGYGWYQSEVHMTAHNSFVLCFTELGLLGLTFWVGLIVFSLYQLGIIRRMVPKDAMDVEIIRLANAVRLGFVAFLVTGWFLSRTYTVTFYVLVGMAAALTAMVELRRGHAMLRPQPAWFHRVLIVEFGAIFLIYLSLKGLKFA